MGERAIAAVSEVLRGILVQSLLHEPPLVEKEEHIVIGSPAEMPHDRHTRVEIRGPLGFSLSYMIVPVGPDETRCQQILGRVLRTLHEHARLEVPEAGGELDLTMLRHPLEEALQLWSALDTVYACALYYDVRIVQLIDPR
jgi:hypothetical protein